MEGLFLLHSVGEEDAAGHGSGEDVGGCGGEGLLDHGVVDEVADGACGDFDFSVSRKEGDELVIEVIFILVGFKFFGRY